ncbi:2506_t:CDS:2, partial [Cetraspora pellucida]
MMNTIPIAGQDLFTEIINVIDEYLTEPISNAIKMEMSQCLFVSANKIEPSFEELHHEQENNQLASEGFIEDQCDAHLIMLQEIVDEVGRKEVLEIWKVMDIRSEKQCHVHFVVIANADESIPEKKSAMFRYKMGIFNDKEVLPTQKPTTVPTTVPMIKKSIHKRNLYGRHNKNHDVPERPVASEVSDNAWEIQTNETSDQTEESETETETEESQDTNEVNLEN